MEKLNIDRRDEVKTSTKRRNLIFKVNPTYQRQKFVVIMCRNIKNKQELNIKVEELQEALGCYQCFFGNLSCWFNKQRTRPLKMNLYMIK